ncbi:spore coat protein [Mesobacillus maritimus]|uniref:Spore coat protein n=1 Tax=Mesobacillus maritimus TaxID=1643336 RepID=A0ABS7K8Y4_9BACI|nr:spore coat protein [Mesobacillus maritimus]MBY0098580.1 spore coat protein [Mesobacillus maritimus]
MPFGAHETMEVHEVLAEKMNMISHFNLYAMQTKNPELKSMIMRHQQEEIQSYDALVKYTHDYTQFTPIPPNTSVSNIKPDQIQYGLDNPSMLAPETNAALNDYEVATAMLLCHKNAAANGVKAALEIADPNLRQMLTNSAMNCVNQAYEVFLFMNQQGLYQVPTIKDHTAKTYLHSYQPSSEGLKAQYTMQGNQNLGKDNPMKPYMQQTTPQVPANYMNAATPAQSYPPSGQMGGGHSQNLGTMGSMPTGSSMGQQQSMNASGQPMKTFGQSGNMNTPPAYQTNMHTYQGNQKFNH